MTDSLNKKETTTGLSTADGGGKSSNQESQDLAAISAIIAQDSSKSLGKAKILEFDPCVKMPGLEELEALAVSEDIDAIRITNLVSEGSCKKLSESARNSSQEHGAVEGLQLNGVPYFMASAGGALSEKYYGSTRAFASSVRKNSDGASALDATLGIFAQMHPQGYASAALENGRVMPAGIFRIYPAAECSEVLPHQDILSWEVDSQIARGLYGQMGWNIYIDMPTLGGELFLYDLQFDQEEFEHLAGNSYGLSWQCAGQPLDIIKPKVGELILINSRRVHAVQKAHGSGHRVTLSGFLGMNENGLMSWA